MVKLKNNKVVLKHFGLLLTFLFIVSCGHQQYAVTKIEGKKIGVTDKVGEVSEIDNFIKPFKENIDKDLNQVLAYCPETLDKSKGEWQTNIGCFLADITLEKSNVVYQKRENQKIDICFLNHGGIRTIIPIGNVSARNAYEVMPFENSAVVVSLKGEQILEIINYIISEKKPHPLAGMSFTIDKNGMAKNILIQGLPFDKDKIYNVVTSDYLSNGGDNMVFFKKAVKRIDTDYKLRNLMIDYFKDVDTLKINHDIRITKE
ncbi:5'-nucleotidase [Flavobacterium sp. SUN046]|uniref:5'-nucleotidase n=1 Tax=Flavobacterium sp. SUN046 TaxID=3002440 RepID=UPI002DB96F5C|nr:5'-nucleotidase [Flavobacterium sp. SUN046]MEC4050547.1 5'-nucleotidase [Flavobacterium sp. SUN046]